MGERNLQPLIDMLTQRDYAVIPDFFSPAEVAAWRQDALAAYQLGLFSAARVGRGEGLQRDNSIRGDEIFWLDNLAPNPAQKTYVDFLEHLRLALNERFMLGLFASECHYTHYQIGSFYKKHLDRHAQSRERMVSVITYLNDEWTDGDGGELRMYLDEKNIREIKPLAGTLVCFFSEALPHEVLPVNRERISLTAWLRIRPAECI